MNYQNIAIITLLTAMLCVPAHTASAGEFSTVLNGKSFHLGSDKSWNEKNYGLGIEYQLDTVSKWKTIFMVNGFRDSYNNMSYMAGGGLHRTVFTSDSFDGLYVDLGVNAFVMKRDKVNDNRPFPGALPSMTIGNRYMGVNVTYMPRFAIKKITPKHAMDKNMRGVVFLQFKMNVEKFLGI